MRFDELQPQTLEQIGSPEAKARARILVEEGRVRHGYYSPDRLQGVVEDSEAFQVEVKIKNDQLSYMCSCPQSEAGEMCPHVLALLKAWLDHPKRFLNRTELSDRLKKYSKRDLADIIIDLADRVPEVRGILKEEEQGLDEILESIDVIIDDVAEDSLEPAEAERKLRRVQTLADRLAQSGRLAEARSIYFYLLDNILALEERLGNPRLFSQDLKGELFEEYCQFIHEDRALERELVQQELEQLETRTAFSRGEFNLSEVKQELQGAA
jgi:uncharacterized Zn finger protein|uniref:SWIM-type domain-containing protein n=1 Tax=Desulfobacca acetoxidans TaxID=60893 RepID=A0A7C3SIP6_9BACT